MPLFNSIHRSEEFRVEFNGQDLMFFVAIGDFHFFF